MTIRTLPVRVDIEQATGRTRISINPEFQQIHAGDGIEWDFRYLGGADVIVEEVVIEFAKPSPFAKATFRSKRPGSARPHRQLSGPASPLAGRGTYTIRCFNIAKFEVAKAQLSLAITPDSE